MRGGFRQNAGRKKGFAAKNAEESRKLLSERLSQEIGPISDILISEAKKGNIRAIRELFDRAWGRPPQAVQEENNNVFSLPIFVNMPQELVQKHNFANICVSPESAERHGLTNVGEFPKNVQ